MVADLHLVNMFGNIEWPSTRKDPQRHFPVACAWTDWQHQQDSFTQLSSGTSWGTNRGAGQGDVFGTISSALVLRTARAEGLAEFASSPKQAKGVCDEWYVDDGPGLVRPDLFDSWLAPST